VRSKVLISAFSCNPERGSEPGVGHFFVSELAKRCDVSVITEEVENRAAIERYQQANTAYASVRFHFLPWPLLDKNGGRITSMGPAAYYRQLRLWEQRAFTFAKALHAETQFDVVHHLTMQGYREPGYLWMLDAPFIWGPVGGHAQMPWRYFPMLGWRGSLQHGFRNLGNSLQARFHRRVHRAARAAKAVIVNTSEERRAFVRLHDVDARVIPEYGAESIPEKSRVRDVSRPLRIAWSGVHVSRKALPILLQALAKLHDVSVELHILSDGPETSRWKSLAADLKVQHRCTWYGRLPRAQALGVMNNCDVFALTSLLDGTSCVLNEAISLGLPVICHATCGFPDIITSDCGILIPLRNPAESAFGFAAALRALTDGASLYDRLARGGRERAASIHQEKRGAEMWEVYQTILSAHGRLALQTASGATSCES
jgi:glycosyltransferase involved in cell wall biosynthesis